MALGWDAALDRAAAVSGAVLLVGPPDSGKSTFALALANRLAEAGRPAAVIDADVGQSEIGPPAAVGMARVEAPAGALSDHRLRGLAFVGDVSPFGHMLPVVLGMLHLARRARERGAEVVVIDTSGLVAGRFAEKLKLAKMEAALPPLTLLFRRPPDLDRLAGLLAAHGEVASVAPPPEVRRKSPAFRKARRQRRWAAYFRGAVLREISAGSVHLVDAWPFSGRALPSSQVQFAAQALGTEVLHAEDTADGLFFCTAATPHRSRLAALHEPYRRRKVAVTPVGAFRDLVVGLVGQDGLCLGLGLLQDIDFPRGVLPVLTPLASTGRVRQVWFGRARVRADGTELGRLRPGDM